MDAAKKLFVSELYTRLVKLEKEHEEVRKNIDYQRVKQQEMVARLDKIEADVRYRVRKIHERIELTRSELHIDSEDERSAYSSDME